MIDLHTHILPQMDDGARTSEISLQMLEMEREQGVDTVVLTPHCYRRREALSRFLERRSESYRKLTDAMEKAQVQGPKLLLAAEVAWAPNMSDWAELEDLCIEGTRNLLLELPFVPWQDQMIDQIYDMMSQRAVTPVFAHLERYVRNQRPDLVEEIIRMGTPIQLSSEPWLHFWERRTVMKLLKRKHQYLLASDCHNTDTRRPNLKDGLCEVRRRLGSDVEKELLRAAEALVAQ